LSRTARDETQTAVPPRSGFGSNELLGREPIRGETMIWIILVMYVWAGLTTACALRQFNDVKLAMDEALPFKESIASVRYSVGVLLTFAAVWPIALPIWLTAMRQERSNP